jgi:cytochrome oxidase Cu insertion factor (SCO1/SenC/PrrC family)
VPVTRKSRGVPVPYRAHVNRAMLVAIALLLPLSGAAGQALSPASDTTLGRLPPNWRDDHGETLRLPALNGALIFVTMAYTSCHRICPMTMGRLVELQRDLDGRGISAEFLIVSYDPGNDDSGAWRRYRTRHGLSRENWHFLSGTPTDTERLARVLGFEFWRDGNHVMHDYRIVALGRDGVQHGIIDAAHGDWRGLQ